MAETIGALRVEISATIAQFEADMKKAGVTLSKWSEGQQRSAMAMGRAHDEALKLNRALAEQRAAQEKAAEAWNKSSLGVGNLASAFSLATNPLTILAGLVTGLAAGLTSATSQLLSTAGAVSDLSAKTGISVEALQVLKHAGAQVGVSLDDISTAVVQMNKRLVDSPKAFEKLGLSAAALKNMRADEAFALIAQKIQSIENPAQQTSAAMQLLGRSGASVLPLLKSDIEHAADEAERFGLVLSEETVAAADELGDRLTTLGEAWDAWKMQSVAAIATSEILADGLDLITLAIGNLAKESADGAKARAALIDDLLKLTQLGKVIEIASALTSLSDLPTVKNKPAGPTIPEIDFAAISAAGLKEAGVMIKEISKDHKEAAAAAKKHADEVKKMADAYSGLGAQKQLELMAEAYLRNKAAIEANAPGFQKFKEDVAKLAVNAATVPAPLRAIVAEMDAMTVAGNAWDMGPTLEELGITLISTKGLWAQTGEVVDAILEESVADTKDWRDALFDAEGGWKNVVEEIINAGAEFADLADIFGELDGLLEAFGATADGALRTLAQGLSNAAQGAAALAAGLASGNPAQMISGITGIVTGVRTLVQSESAVNRFIGGFAVLGPIGGTIAAIFGGPAYSAAERLRFEIQKMQTEFVNAQGGLLVLEQKARAAGVSLDAMWNARTVAEYEAAVGRVTAAIEMHDRALELTQKALDRFHLTLGDTGPAFAAGQLQKQFADLYRDIKLAQEAGVDLDKILQGGAEEINHLVQESLKAGVALPEFMRPFIARLIETHQLLDENGQEITDISQLPFTDTLEAGVRDLIESVKDLVNAMRGIPPEVNSYVKVHVQTTHTNDGGGDEEFNENLASFATGGVGDFGSGTLAILHGREAIVPLDDLEGGGLSPEVAGALGGAAAPVIQNHLYLDGQQMRDWIIQQMRVGALTRV